MIRENWKDWRFWRWWWAACVRTDAKLMAAALVVLALLVGGYFASGSLTGGAKAASPYVLETTITKVMTVKDHGRTVVKRVPVSVTRTVVGSSTAHDTVVETRVVTKPGGARVVIRKVVRTVPVVHRGKTVRNNVTSFVTNARTVTNAQTVTNEQTVTRPVTSVATKTVTSPPATVTHAETQTQTATVTHTETVVQTVTQPPETVTVTTTAPGITITLP